MKKFGSLALAVIMFCIMSFSVGAAFVFDKDSNFTVEIEDGFVFSEEESSDNIFMFKKGADTFNINYTATTKDDYWADASVEDLENYKEIFSEMMEEQYVTMELEWNVDVKYVNLEKVEDGYTALVYFLHTTGTDVSFYQKIYQFIGENNVYTLTYTSPDKKVVEKVYDIAKTFVMNENEMQKPDAGSNVLYNTIKGACAGVCIAVVLVVIKKKKDNKLGNNSKNIAYIPETDNVTINSDSSNEN